MTATLNDMDIVLSACLVQPNMYIVLSKYLVPECFPDEEHRYIYELLLEHLKRYEVHPQIKDLTSMVTDEDAVRRGLVATSVRDLITDLMTQAQSIDEVIKDKAKKLILEYRMNVYLTNLLEVMKKGSDKIYTETMRDRLMKLMEIDFSTDDAQTINFDSYWKAKQELLGEDGNSVLKSFLPGLNETQTAQGFTAGTLNMVVGPPGTGKTTLLINEGKNTALHGGHVLHVFIGDMTDYSVMTKYLASMCEIDARSLVTMSKDKLKEVFDCVNLATNNALDRVHRMVYPASAIRIEDLIAAINRTRVKNNINYKEIIIDYPDNVIHGDNSMYLDGGAIYAQLEKLAKESKSVVWVASQPKTEYWDSEIIPLRGASESSRKQHTVDTMITFNLHSRDADFGTIFVAKAREGQTGGYIRVKTDYSRSLVKEISEDEYTEMLRNYNTKTLGKFN